MLCIRSDRNDCFDTLTLRSGNVNTHFAIEALKEPHQPLDAVIGEFSVFEPGEFGLFNA